MTPWLSGTDKLTNRGGAQRCNLLFTTRGIATRYACFFWAKVENVTNGQTHIGGWVENVTNGQTHGVTKGTDRRKVVF